MKKRDRDKSNDSPLYIWMCEFLTWTTQEITTTKKPTAEMACNWLEVWNNIFTERVIRENA